MEITEYEGSSRDKKKIHLIIVPETEQKKDRGKEITIYITIDLEYHHFLYHYLLRNARFSHQWLPTSCHTRRAIQLPHVS